MKGKRNPRRHHPDHKRMKKASNRKMRREWFDRMPSLEAKWFCCGGHHSDWRY